MFSGFRLIVSLVQLYIEGVFLVDRFEGDKMHRNKMCHLAIFCHKYPVYLFIYPFFSLQCSFALLPSLTNGFMVLIGKKSHMKQFVLIQEIFNEGIKPVKIIKHNTRRCN